MTPQEISKTLVLYIGHLTDDTCNRYLPDNQQTNSWYEKGEYGWFVYVSNDAGSHPKDLEDCLNYAREHDCDWIMFDRDGPLEPDLRCYDW